MGPDRAPKRRGRTGCLARRFARNSPARMGAAVAAGPAEDRKSTRLNSSHRCISYAVFCLKKKKKNYQLISHQTKHASIKRSLSSAYTESYAHTGDVRRRLSGTGIIHHLSLQIKHSESPIH